MCRDVVRCEGALARVHALTCSRESSLYSPTESKKPEHTTSHVLRWPDTVGR